MTWLSLHCVGLLTWGIFVLVAAPILIHGEMTDPRRYSNHEARCSCRAPWALIALLLLVLPLASCGTDNYADRHWDRHDKGNP